MRPAVTREEWQRNAGGKRQLAGDAEGGEARLTSQKTMMVAREATILRAIPALYLFSRLQMPRAAYTPICGPQHGPLGAHISAVRAYHRERAQLHRCTAGF